MDKPYFKLNRIQRKNYVRTLQATVRNIMTGGQALQYSLDERKQAAVLLLELGNEDEIFDTFNSVILSGSPDDAEFRSYIRDLMAEGYKTGLSEADEGE